MADSRGPDLWYPTVEDIVMIHGDIIDEDPDAAPGVQEPSRIQFALDYVQGEFGREPPTVHEKAFHLMRLIASNHWFVDGNKRTALNATELFYLVNGYELDYGDDVRSILKLFSVREDLIDREVGPEYLRDRTTPVEVDIDEADPWSGLAVVLLALVAKFSDRDPEELLSDSELDVESVRNDMGLTTEYGTTVNLDDERGEHDGG